MKCNDYQKWLHLNRDGELTSRQSAKLERHLRHCRSCADEKRRIEKADRFIHAAGTVVPRPSEPEALTLRIMDAIEHPRGAVDMTRPGRESNRWLDWFYVPRIRFAAAGIAVFILGVFLFQGAMILHRIGRLEEKMTRRQEAPVSAGTIFSKRTARAAAARVLEQADLACERLPDDDDLVVIRKSTLRKMLRSLTKSQRGDERIIEQLLRELRLFNEIDVEKGIRKRELKKIVEKKKDILNQMYKL